MKLSDERTLEAYEIQKDSKIEMVVVSTYSVEPSILHCLCIGFLKVKPMPNIEQILKEHGGHIPSNFKQTLTSADYWNPSLPIEIFFDLDRLQEVLMTSDVESMTYKLWKACAEYLSKELMLVVKEKETGKVFLQEKHNFNLFLPDDLSEWTFNRLDVYKKFDFTSPNEEFKPKTTYTLFFNVVNGLTWEFSTSGSTKEVDAVLQEIGMDIYAPLFRQHHIDCDTMMLLEENHLKEMGIPLGPRLKIATKIQSLKNAFLMDT